MLRSLFLAALVGLSLGIPLDNGLEGEPEVQCGPTSIQFSFSSQNSFEGMVYAKNHHDVEECRVPGDGSTRGSNIEMNFESCNVRRFRSIEPKGIFVRATVVVQFHRFVLTKVDRAFHLECFYMEADKTVDQELEVSMVTTELRTFTVPMPVCRYDILEGDNGNGQPIRFVTIGDKIYHQWTCDTETTDTFCMEVYSCTVDDGQANPASTIELVDVDGCATDRNLLDNLEYPTDLIGGMASHVFKYADRPQLYFNCQIRIGVKEPNSECIDWREDGQGACQAAPESFGRKKRSAERRAPQVGFLDIAPASPLFVADVELTNQDIPASLRRVRVEEPTPVAKDQMCMSQGYLGAVMGAVGVLGVSTITLSILLLARCLRAPKPSFA